MKFLKVLFLFLFLSNTICETALHAQDALNAEDLNLDISMTDVFKDDRKFTDLSFSVSDKNKGVYLVRRYNKGYYIEHYDSNLNIVKEYDIELHKKEGDIENAFLRGNNLCLIESFYDKSTKELQYYSRTAQDNEATLKREFLFSIPLKDIKKPNYFSLFTTYDSKSDDDVLGMFKTSIHVNYIAFTKDILDDAAEKHSIFVFDNNLNPIYQTEFTRGIKDRKFILQNIDVSDEDGTVYLLGKTFTKDKKQKNSGGKYQFELYKIKKDHQMSVVFDSGDKFIGSLTTKKGDDYLFCVGFYSLKNDNRYKGLVHLAIDPNDLTIKSTKYTPFTSQFIIDKYGKTKDKELKNIVFREVFITDTNEAVIHAEEFFIEVTQTMGANGMMGGQNRTYHYRDVICAKISSGGELIWARNINKKQTSGNLDRYLSFSSTHVNGKSYLFLNSNGKVKKLSNDRIEFRGGSSNKADLTAVVINDEGDFDFAYVLDSDKAEVPFEAGAAVMTEKGKSLVFKGRVGNKKQLLKISVD